jgi:hypothetical protein
MISFHPNGWLKADVPLLVDWDSFVSEFVFNQHRSTIFETYKTWLYEVKQLELGPFYQWIDGSFISKKPAPKDIDIVSFVQFDAFDANESGLRQLKKMSKKVDCYWVKVYPEGHSSRFVTQFDKAEWLHLFSTDRMRNTKGFVQL